MDESWRFSRHLKDVLECRSEIKASWIYETIDQPDFKEEVSDTEVKYWKKIPEFGERFLRVVVNPKDMIVITAFFDRSFKP